MAATEDDDMEATLYPGPIGAPYGAYDEETGPSAGGGVAPLDDEETDLEGEASPGGAASGSAIKTPALPRGVKRKLPVASRDAITSTSKVRRASGIRLCPRDARATAHGTA